MGITGAAKVQRRDVLLRDPPVGAAVPRVRWGRLGHGDRERARRGLLDCPEIDLLEK
jgi:hypothetical protein